MPKALKARGFLAIESDGEIIYIKVLGEERCVVDSEWIENGVVDRQILRYVDELVRSHGY